MKEFQTISTVEILNAAYMHILDKYLRKSDQLAVQHNDITEYWLKRYKSQMDELHAEILKLEKEMRING